MWLFIVFLLVSVNALDTRYNVRRVSMRFCKSLYNCNDRGYCYSDLSTDLEFCSCHDGFSGDKCQYEDIVNSATQPSADASSSTGQFVVMNFASSMNGWETASSSPAGRRENSVFEENISTIPGELTATTSFFEEIASTTGVSETSSFDGNTLRPLEEGITPATGSTPSTGVSGEDIPASSKGDIPSATTPIGDLSSTSASQVDLSTTSPSRVDFSSTSVSKEDIPSITSPIGDLSSTSASQVDLSTTIASQVDLSSTSTSRLDFQSTSLSKEDIPSITAPKEDLSTTSTPHGDIPSTSIDFSSTSARKEDILSTASENLDRGSTRPACIFRIFNKITTGTDSFANSDILADDLTSTLRSAGDSSISIKVQWFLIGSAFGSCLTMTILCAVCICFARCRARGDSCVTQDIPLVSAEEKPYEAVSNIHPEKPTADEEKPSEVVSNTNPEKSTNEPFEDNAPGYGGSWSGRCMQINDQFPIV